MVGLLLLSSVLAFWLAGLVSAFETQVMGVRREDATPLVVVWLLSWVFIGVVLLVVRAVS
jgi:hypothetical protein